MSLYIFGCILLSILTFISGFFVFNKYSNSSGIFYLLFSILVPFWYGFFILSFGWNFDADTTLKIYRFQYSISTIGLYSILFFLAFYSTHLSKFKHHFFPIILFFLTIFYISNFTDLIVKDVEVSTSGPFFIEIFGTGYILFIVLYIFLIPLCLITGIYKIYTLRSLHKIRMKYILFGFISFVGLCLSFIVFIPFFASEFLLEKWIPFFLFPLVASVFYSSHRYDFTDYKITLTKFFTVLVSAFFAFFFLLILKSSINYLGHDFHDFWDIQNAFSWFDTIFVVIVFYVVHKFLRLKTPYYRFQVILTSIQDNITNITTFEELNRFLNTSFQKQLGIKSALLSIETDKYPETVNFFTKHMDSYFIRDYVFLEENKYKFNIEKIQSEVSDNSKFILPLRAHDNSIQGLFLLGEKTFSDMYSTQEIESLQIFVTSIQRHIKYMKIYETIHDLNVNLDKKVDVKTIEYNNLINRQKEFIAFVSHEIKNPVTNALFLSDSISGDIEGFKDSHSRQKRIKEDVSLLNSELIKIGELTRKIFSIEKYDLGKIKLFKEHTNIYDFLQEEIQVFEKKYDHVDFIVNIDNVGNCEIDRVQLRQVVHNLLENAVKFTTPQEPKVSISLSGEVGEIIVCTIEDNGHGFQGVDISSLFDKYSTGDSSSIGLGMGLYLCKRIVELHGWNIQADKSEKLGGARFTIIAK